jgi:YHS domain-containing protein
MFKYLLLLALMVPNYAYSYECSKKIDELSSEYKISINCKMKTFSKEELKFQFKQASQDLIDKSENAMKSFLSSMNKDLIYK